MESVKILIMPPVPAEVMQRIQNVDSRINVIDARGWFDVELRATWPQWTVDREEVSRQQPRRA